MRKILLLMIALTIFIGGCTKTDPGPKICVEQVLANAKILDQSNPLLLNDLKTSDPSSQPDWKQLSAARDKLDALFPDEKIRKRLLAGLRMYGFKDWEIQKTVDEQGKTFVVTFLRSDSDVAGEPVENRPGWRKALFELKKQGENWIVVDIDRIVKEFGSDPVYNLDKMSEEQENMKDMAVKGLTTP